jgi:pyridoxal phosphate enzyme (YggS family)
MFEKEVYEQLKKEIPSSVTILAATKTKPIEDIKAAVEAGITNIGENYVQEAQEKYQLLKDYFKEKNISFHLIGHLQSNKAKIAASIFDCIQSLDSIKLANILNIQAEKLNKNIRVFIEVNFEEEQKSGININELDNLINHTKKLKNLQLLGLMTIPPIGKELECFKILKELKEKYNFQELSIGMSNDYLQAIENGSTMIRLGTKLFGKRD